MDNNNQKSDIKITKFKLLDNKINISFVEQNPDYPNEQGHQISTKDRPMQVLLDSLDAMNPNAREQCELPEDAEIEVYAFSLKYGLDENQNEVIKDFVLSLKHHLKSGESYTINMPKKSESQISIPMIRDLKTLLHHVTNFYKGERLGKQDDLFNDPEGNEVMDMSQVQTT